MLPVMRRLAITYKAGPSSNLGSAPQGGSTTEPTAIKKMELDLSIYSWMIVWMAIKQKIVCIPTQNCVLYRETEY